MNKSATVMMVATSGGVPRHTVRGMRKITKTALVGGMAAAAIAATVSVAAPASADPWLSSGERQYLSALYANGMQAPPGWATSNLVAGGYWVCDILGNHSGGYVASRVWQDSHSRSGGITYAQANTVVYAAIANLCPYRWY